MKIVDSLPGIHLVVQTPFSDVRLMPDTWAAFRAEHAQPDGLVHTDRRTRSGKALRRLEDDICAIAEVEWLRGEELYEF